MMTSAILMIIMYIDCSNHIKTDYKNLSLDEKHSFEAEILTNLPEISLSITDLNSYLDFLDPDKWSSNQNGDQIEIYSSPSDFLASLEIESFVIIFHDHLINYIESNLKKSEYDTYKQRIKMIKDTLDMICDYDLNYPEVFTSEIDADFTHMLNDLKFKYSDRLVLDNETYDCFSDDLDRKMKELKKIDRYKALEKNIKEGNNFHLREFIKMYKFIKIFPELLSLGYLTTQSSLKKVTTFLHLLTLFLVQNEQNLLENRVFVMFLIKKTFCCSSRTFLDLIYILQVQESITTDDVKIYFFTIEFDNELRKKIRRRIKKRGDPNCYFDSSERIYYNIVLGSFLFQHLIYLRYNNIQNSEFMHFKILVHSYFSGNDCFKCIFKKFLDLV